MKKVFLIIAFLTVSLIALCQNTSFQRTDSCNKVKVTMINGVVHMIDGSANVIASDANNYTIVIYWQENQKITFDWRTVQSPISGQAFTSRNQLIEILGKYFFFRRRVTGGTGVETDPIWNAQKSGYVQTSRTLTVTGNSPINISGGTQSLAGNRTWTASADTSILGTQYDIVSDTSHIKSTGAENKYGSMTFADSVYNSKLSINSLVGTTGTGALKSVSDTGYTKTTGDLLYGNYTFNNSLLTNWTNSTSLPRGFVNAQYSADALASRLYMDKSRGTFASKTVITTGDTLGFLMFRGYDGTTFRHSASITALSTGTIGTNRVPGILTFSTATDAAPGVLTERWRINETGILQSNGAQSISTTTGTLTLSSGGGNGNIQLNPNGSGKVQTAAALSCGSLTASSGSISGISITTLSSLDAFYGANGCFNFNGTSDWYRIGRVASTVNQGYSLGSPTTTNHQLSIQGQQDFNIRMDRHPTSNTAGNLLSLIGGGATSGSTDKGSDGISAVPGVTTGTGFTQTTLGRYSRAASTSTSDNTLQTAIFIPSEFNLSDNVQASLFEVALTDDNGTGGAIEFTITATDGDTTQVYTGYVIYSIANGNGVCADIITETTANTIDVPAATTNMTTSWAITETCSTKATIKVTADAGFTPTAMKIRYKIHNGGNTTITQL